ncbi:MAG TPA: sulfite exporter TauE/SafE family protein [Gemmatimonadales bacterium]|nr:sulfite exporter TauE/SafE family protein [Gemmatimonadales bacterium]
MNAKDVLLAVLAIVAALYAFVFARGLRRARDGDRLTPAKVATGFVTNFFDTLGIGSYAPTTALFRFWKMVPDERIPGTLNVGHTLPTIVQAFIFTRIVPVDARTLILMIGASMVGAWLGAGVVASWSRRTVQVGMGLALIAAAGLMLARQLELTPAGGDALGLTGLRLVVAVGVNFALGALMTLGIGLYAPCMILVSLLGMNPTTAFPIMMGSCAFLMPVASARFIRSGSFSPGACLGLLIGGVPAVLIAALIVKKLPIGAVRWLVVVVVLYTATALLRAARRESLSATGPADPSASR